MNKARVILAAFPEVTKVVSQVGRPDDGTDTTGFFNTEYFVDLLPKAKWRAVFHQNKDELIGAMDRELEKMPGVIWNFSQPISDNVEEAVSGVKGELAVKLYGDDLKLLETKADQIVGIMGGVQGVQDLGVFRVIGQPNLNYTVDRQAAARFGINVADVQDAIQTAVGGGAVSQVLRGEARYDLVVRYQKPYRDTQGSDRRHPPAFAVGGASFPGPIDQCEDGRRRRGNLSRAEPALRCHQIQRSRTRSRQHGGRGHCQGQQASQASSRLPHRLGGRIPEPEAG